MQTFIIGRDSTNQIVLNDKLVSRQHAQLTVNGSGQVKIKDLGSSNGTFVNGNRITESMLNNGDIVKCGSVFLDWNKYLNGPVTNNNYLRQDGIHDYSPQGNTVMISNKTYGFKDVFKYLTTRIFDIGDLFQTDWDRSFSIYFLKGIPVLLTLLVSAIAYPKLQVPRFYFSPTVMVFFVFAVCPFITFYLISFRTKVSADKIALASGLAGFLQFSSMACYALYIILYHQHFSSNTGDGLFGYAFKTTGLDLFTVITGIILFVFIVNLAIGFYLFIYKYFVSLGITRSRSIYLIATTLGLNSVFQLLSIYVIFLIVKDSVANFNF